MVWHGPEVVVIFRCGEQAKEVFFELEPDEFFGPHVAVIRRP